LKLTICEPAMGSGAFINEALNQLADAYLERKQEELGKRISPDAVPHRAAEGQGLPGGQQRLRRGPQPHRRASWQVSLWLNILYPGSPNALVWGAPGRGQQPDRRPPAGVYRRGGQKRSLCLTKPQMPARWPRRRQKIGKPGGRPRPEGTIYHWLLPDAGMAAFDSEQVSSS
jgi:hypothetical protein